MTILSEFIKLIVEQETKKIDVYRGMTDVTLIYLSKVMKQPLPKEGGSVNVDINISVSKMGWWSNNKRFALVYAITSPVNVTKHEEGQQKYDALLYGEVILPAELSVETGGLAHILRAQNAIIHVTKIVFVPMLGDTKTREQNLSNYGI